MLTPVKHIPPVLSRIAQTVEEMRKAPQVECPLTHRFTPGMYVREIFVPKGTRLVTMIHRTEHPFVVSSGKIAVWCPGDERPHVIEAPYTGITKPGTLRLAVALEDTVWTTFHATNKTTPEEVAAEIVFEPTEALISKEIEWHLSQPQLAQ